MCVCVCVCVCGGGGDWTYRIVVKYQKKSRLSKNTMINIYTKRIQEATNIIRNINEVFIIIILLFLMLLLYRHSSCYGAKLPLQQSSLVVCHRLQSLHIQ